MASKLWLFGPQFIREGDNNNVDQSVFHFDNESMKKSSVESKIVNVVVTNNSSVNIFERCSNFLRLQYAIARILRLRDRSNPQNRDLDPCELLKSFIVLVEMCTVVSIFRRD